MAAAIFFIAFVLGGIGLIAANMPANSNPTALNGSYLYDGGTVRGTIKIVGDKASVQDGDYDIEAKIERDGNTLRFTDQQAYKDGYLTQDLQPIGGGVDLASVTDDNQSITLTLQNGHQYKFVRQ